ncbi:MAG TPA: right-handed parallel beta-helix repeat-containing protein, partial [Thermoanaerobaculia bacterium]
TTGSIQTTPNTSVTINVYAAPRRGPLGHAEANVLVSSDRVQTDATGNATFTLRRGVTGGVDETLLVPSGWFAATATTEDGTSELSAPIAVQSDTIRVTTVADAGPGSLRDAIDRANRSNCQARCWIVFEIPHEQLTSGVAVIEPLSPLPAIANPYVHIDGSSQTWNGSDTNPNGPEVEIRGTRAGAGPGLKIGTPDARVPETFIHALAITGFAGAGISIDATDTRDAGGAFDVRIQNAFIGIDPATGEARGNGGDGVFVRGERNSFAAGSQWVVRNSVIGGNGGHGVHLEGQALRVQGSQIGVFGNAPRPNGGAGIFAGPGLDFSLTANTIAFNRGAGIATAPEARAVAIEGTTFSANGALGIDRNNDGVGGGTAEGVTPRPSILGATYDAAKNVTVIEGEVAADAPSLPLPTDGRSEIVLTLFASDAPDPTGFGEGARLFGGVPVLKGQRFRTELPGDLRGRFITATSSLALCYFEFGCYPRDTSEFSNAVAVK